MPKKPKAVPKPWPRLSETLTGPKAPDTCQACGASSSPGNAYFTRWQEHDEDDQPEARYVVLCEGCAGRLIEKHPRIYRQLDSAEPWPGNMPICAGCRWVKELTCTCPLAKMNGGPGMGIKGPSRVHVCRSPRRMSGWHWWGQVVDCEGKHFTGPVKDSAGAQP